MPAGDAGGVALGIAAGGFDIAGITTGGGVLALGLDGALMPPTAATIELGLPAAPAAEGGGVVLAALTVGAEVETAAVGALDPAAPPVSLPHAATPTRHTRAIHKQLVFTRIVLMRASSERNKPHGLCMIRGGCRDLTR